MAIYNVYRLRSNGRPSSGQIRLWQGEARSENHAIILAAQARNLRPDARRDPMWARHVDADEFAKSPKTIIEES